MTRLYLLGVRKGPNVDCIDTDRMGGYVITAEDDSLAALSKQEEELRQEGIRLQHAWFTVQKLHGPESSEALDAKAEYGRALRTWADFTGNQGAKDHAYKLLNGFV